MPLEIKENGDDLYRRLLIADTQKRLPGAPITKQVSISLRQCAILLSHASLLALSKEFENRRKAYEIATRIASLFPEEYSLLNASDFVLSRLGNFPGRQLLRNRHLESFGHHNHRSPYLELEAIAREIENTVEDAAGKPAALTNFQYDTLEALGNNSAVSVSAPTSAGKSFILSLHVIRKLRKSKQACVVYLVPTRALIRQVVLALRKDLLSARLTNVPVRSVPLPISKEELTRGVVYVLTQERFLSLLHSEDGEAWVDTLIVDEAQGISDGSRGVLLHTAVDEVSIRFPKAEIHFASPMSSNPEYLLKIFHREKGLPTQDRNSPVSQNLLLVERSQSGGNKLAFKLLEGADFIDLGIRDVTLHYGGNKILNRRADFALALSARNGCCIVYANGARDSEIIAEYIANALPNIESPEPHILEFIDFLKNHIHPDYGLIEVLKKGVAFHYSNMPSSVRGGVEELAKDGYLNFICCTSTLLQGVNLPARDIIVENPKRGMGKPMKRADFVNLAGRAGRLLREFHGNVWCLRPDKWEEKSYTGEPLQEIESAYIKCLKDGGLAVQKIFDEDISLSDWERETATTTLSKLYTEYVLPGKPLIDPNILTHDNHDLLKKTIAKIGEIETALPFDVFSKNHAILPMRLEALYQYFCSVSDIHGLIPIAPFIKGTNGRLYQIFETVERILQNDKTNSFKYYYRLAKEWLHQRHLHEIIEDKIKHDETNLEDINKRNTIYNVIEDIEKVIRFRFVKHLRAYNDVLSVILVQRGYVEEAKALPPIHLFLECGAADPIALGFISVGLSRTSSLLIKARLRARLNPDATPEDCLQALRQVDINSLKLPVFCKREVHELLSGIGR